MCLSRTSSLSREQRPKKTKIGTEVAHVTRDSDSTFNVKRSKVNLQGRGHIVAASMHRLFEVGNMPNTKQYNEEFNKCDRTLQSDKSQL